MKKLIFLIFLTITSISYSQSDYVLGESYYGEGEYEKATQIFKKLYSKSPFNNSYLSRLISCYQETEQFLEAEKLLKSRIKKNRNQGFFYVYLGYNYERQQLKALAKVNYDLALKSIDKNPSYGGIIGRTFKDYNLLDNAILAFEKVMSKNKNANYSFQIAQIYGVDMVLGASEKFKIIDHFQNLEKQEKATVFASKIKEVNEFVPSYSKGDRTRSFLKIQDGCDYFCTFCTIPLARGKSRNHSVAATVEVAKEVALTPAKEVILTGVNIGDFGQGEGENFFDLIQALDKVEGINRYRISSIEPNLLSNEIIEFVAQSDKFMPHFHIPLQAGSNKILKAMRRKYLKELYVERVARIKELMQAYLEES